MKTPKLVSTLRAGLILLAISGGSAIASDSHTRAFYDFNETDGLTISNTCPRGMLDGTLENGATRTNFSVCGNGSALCLDGVIGYAQLPADALNNLPAGTFEASIYLLSYHSNASFIISKGDADVLTEFSISVFDPTFPADRAKRIAAGAMGSPDILVGGTRIELGQWYKIAFTWDGQFWRLYVNDILDAEMPSTGVPVNSNNGPTLGWHRHFTNPRFHGYVDDVRISDAALTFSQPVLFPGTGHYYKVYTNQMAWTQALVFAQSQTFNCSGGHLVTISSQGENDFVASLVAGGTAWIGGFQAPGSAEPTGGWQWITGEPFAYTNWNSGEPNDGNPTVSEGLLQLYGQTSAFYGRWNDAYDYPDAFVVEFEPLHVSIEVSQIEVCWNSRANLAYQVEFRSDLTTKTWTALGSPVVGTGAIMCLTDSTRAGAQRFYRVRELP